MKKIFMLMIVALATVTVRAINVDEAYAKIAAIPGAALSDVPESDCAKEGMDWGKVVMFINVSDATIERVKQVLAQITDSVVLDEVTPEKGQVIGYAARQSDGRTRALVSVSMPGVGLVIVYAQGGDDVVSGMSID